MSNTGFRGVHKEDNGKFQAYIGIDKKKVVLGRFDSLDEAIQARKEAEEKHPIKYKRKIHHELIGKKFSGSRLFVDDWGIDGKSRTVYRCTCDCGNQTEVTYSQLKSGKTSSCGCYRSEFSSKSIEKTYKNARETHELSRIDGTKAISLNQKKSKNNTSGVKGVSMTRDGKYRAYLNIARKQKHLGFFGTIEEAVAARKKAEEIYYEPILKEFENRKHNAKKPRP